MHVYICVHVVMWVSEDNCEELVLFLDHVCLRGLISGLQAWQEESVLTESPCQPETTFYVNTLSYALLGARSVMMFLCLSSIPEILWALSKCWRNE